MGSRPRWGVDSIARSQIRIDASLTNAKQLAASLSDRVAIRRTCLIVLKEPFDQVARAIQIRAEADQVFAISFRWNVCPCTLLAGKLPDLVGVVAAIRKKLRLGKQGTEENRTKPIVVRLTSREREMDRQAIGVHDRVNLTGLAPRERPMAW